jgi:YidC/Oxa1 family membrane protein insertase
VWLVEPCWESSGFPAAIRYTRAATTPFLRTGEFFLANIFGFVIHPMELGLVWLATQVGNAGIGIILFTIFVRLVLSPLTITQLRNAKNMQRIQPLVGELRQKHGKDKQQLQKATMELYREHKVNPAMGCLPTILQFPILIGLFYALLHLGQTPFNAVKGKHKFSSSCTFKNLETGKDQLVNGFPDWLNHCYAVSGASNTPHIYDLFHQNFLWLSNGLGSSDPLYVLPVLAGVTQWVQMRMMATKSADPQQQMMNTMMNFMPLMIVFFALRYASGLSLYWVTSTLIGIIIQYRITGLGLLPRRESVMSFIGGAVGGATRSSLTPRKIAPPKRLESRPAVITAPEAGGDGQSARGTKNGAIDGNGSTRKPQVKGAAARPRTRANRAKGGRGGGRRG